MLAAKLLKNINDLRIATCYVKTEYDSPEVYRLPIDLWNFSTLTYLK